MINELLASGYSVQLRHNAKETSWENVTEHGYITVYGPDGETKLAHRDGFQHNRLLRSGGSWDGTAVEKLIEEVAKALVK